MPDKTALEVINDLQEALQNMRVLVTRKRGQLRAARLPDHLSVLSDQVNRMSAELRPGTVCSDLMLS